TGANGYAGCAVRAHDGRRGRRRLSARIRVRRRDPSRPRSDRHHRRDPSRPQHEHGRGRPSRPPRAPVGTAGDRLPRCRPLDPGRGGSRDDGGLQQPVRGARLGEEGGRRPPDRPERRAADAQHALLTPLADPGDPARAPHRGAARCQAEPAAGRGGRPQPCQHPALERRPAGRRDAARPGAVQVAAPSHRRADRPRRPPPRGRRGCGRFALTALAPAPAAAEAILDTATMSHRLRHLLAPEGTLAVTAAATLVRKPDSRALVEYRLEGDAPRRLYGKHFAKAVRAARRAGGWLARLHASEIRPQRTLDMRAEIENTSRWAARVGELHPAHAGLAQALAAELARWVTRLPFTAEVPIHKDFHHGHVVASRRLGVIDFDEVRMGDRSLDPAHFCTYLWLQSVRSSFLHRQIVERGFLDEYWGRSRRGPEATFAFFVAYTCMKIAKQLAQGT